MATTVLALFRERQDAEAAIDALRSARFDSARIGIARPGDARRVPRYGVVAVTGVVGGTIACALLGVVVGLITGGLLPTTHAVLPGGWFVPFMLGIAGAGTGAVAGLLTSQSLAERGAYYYDDEVRSGRTLVTVRADSARAAEARRILVECGGFDAAPVEGPMRKAS